MLCFLFLPVVSVYSKQNSTNAQYKFSSSITCFNNLAYSCINTDKKTENLQNRAS